MGQLASEPPPFSCPLILSAIGIKVVVKSVHNSAPNYLASSGSLNSPRVRDRVGEGKGAPALHSARRYLTEISAPVDRRFPAKLVLHGPFFVPGFSLF